MENIDLPHILLFAWLLIVAMNIYVNYVNRKLCKEYLGLKKETAELVERLEKVYEDKDELDNILGLANDSEIKYGTRIIISKEEWEKCTGMQKAYIYTN